jgi:hypothetical protein
VKKPALALAAAVVVAALALLWQRRAPRAPAEEASEGSPALAAAEDTADTTDTRQRTRQLAQENLALLRERAALKSALHATTAAPIPGLPPPPSALYSADEKRLFDEIHQRVFSEAVPKLVEMHRAAKGPPPPGTTPEALFGAVLDAAEIPDVKALLAHIEAVKKLKEQNAAPAADAPLAERVLWLLAEAGDSVEREVKDALPPARWDELSQLPFSGFGYSVSQNDGHWVVEPARPRLHP